MALGLLSRTHTAAGRVSQFAVADMQRMLSMETEEQVWILRHIKFDTYPLNRTWYYNDKACIVLLPVC